MIMRTVRTKVFKFDELTPEAQKKAIDYLRLDHNPWQHENFRALEEFCKIFPARIDRRGDLIYTGDVELKGYRLATYIRNNYGRYIFKPKQYWICDGRPNTVGANSKHRDSKIFVTEDGCPLTGFWMDNEILKPIFDFLRNPSVQTDFEDLIIECSRAYDRASEKDFEFQTSDEQTIETIKENEYEFLKDGSIYHNNN